MYCVDRLSGRSFGTNRIRTAGTGDCKRAKGKGEGEGGGGGDFAGSGSGWGRDSIH